MVDEVERWAADAVKCDVHALYLAGRDPRVPAPARTAAATAAAYALSPIGLVPELIPWLGRLEDRVLKPFAIRLATRMVPPALLAEQRAAAARATVQPQSNTAAHVIVAIWTALTASVAWLAYRELGR
jgi:uncharacterized membrane protein YkvA (DUF1232 family)